ncbi:MAG: methionyl-tRNA formyltransferase [Bacteroidia bacterium]|jgi:methionyl-tRNA formyltransferase
MKFGLFVSGGLGLEVMKQLFTHYQPAFVATDSGSTGIIDFAEQCNLPLFKGNPRKGKLMTFLGDQRFELGLSVNYLFLLEQNILDRFDVAVNFHGSLLPRYRGRTPHVWAIINNEIETGITAHLIEEGCDTGPVILQKRVPILKDDTGADILKKYESLYPGMVLQLMQMAENGEMHTTPQDESQASYFGKRTPDDGGINWNWDMERIRNWVRAQAYPYPGAFTFCEGQKVIIDKVVPVLTGNNSDESSNGTILYINEQNKPVVKVSDGCLILEQIRNVDLHFKPLTILHDSN